MSKIRRLKADSLPHIFARVYARRGLCALAQSAAMLGLTKADTAWLFGITRKTVDDWYRNGVPLSRVADVERVADMARALHARFIPERIPEITREPLPGLDERRILEAARSNGPAAVLNMLDRALSYVPQ